MESNDSLGIEEDTNTLFQGSNLEDRDFAV